MDEGHPRMMKYLAASLGVPRDLDDYIYLSQVQQVDVIKLGVEHWRRRWPASAGAVFWQLNDCWPVASWSAIDYFGRPKGLLYAARRFFAPALVSLRPVSPEPWGPTDLEVWLTHDRPQSPPVRIEATVWSLDGKRISRREIDTRLPAAASRCVGVLKYDTLGLNRPEAGIVHVQLRAGGRVLSTNLHCFAPDKYLTWPAPRIDIRVRPAGKQFEIELTGRSVARAIHLSADRWEGRFSDNFFDLTPGQYCRVTWTPQRLLPEATAFRRGLRLRALGSRGVHPKLSGALPKWQVHYLCVIGFCFSMTHGGHDEG